MSSQLNSNRILKNTIFLYLRMIVITVVSFFTVRITLQVLGVEDYGVYNVVGGLVAFLGIISATMSSATQRYLAFDLGKEDTNSFQNTFSLLLLVFCILSAAIIIIGEALGPWLIANYLVIPKERLVAAHWVYQCSLLSFCLSLIRTPYIAAIIAYERMNVFAFIGLFEAFGKALVAVLLFYINYDKLIVFGFLLLFISIITFIINVVYCRKKLVGCRYRHYWNKKYLIEIISYTGWNLFGTVSGTLNTSGISLVLNLFFGPLVNAAKGIADRISGIVGSFSVNFYQAIAPQIIKTYAAGEYDYSKMLVIKSSKLSFFLLYIISLPLLYGMPTLLNIWLGEESVTNDMIIFSRLILIYSLVNIFEQPITMLIRATGDIKKYQIFVGIITLCTIPLSVLFFKMGLPAYWSIIALTLIYFVALFVRIIIAYQQVGLSPQGYFIKVILPVLLVIVISVGLVELFRNFFYSNVYIIMAIAFIFGSIIIWTIGLKKEERQMLLEKLHFIRKQ